jgi:hypothetical protein
MDTGGNRQNVFPRKDTTVNTTCAHNGRYLLFAAHCQYEGSGKEWVGLFHGHCWTTTIDTNKRISCYVAPNTENKPKDITY